MKVVSRYNVVAVLVALTLQGCDIACAGDSETQNRVTGALRENAVNFLMVNGSRLRDITLKSRCVSSFKTDIGSVDLNWSHVPNLASRTVNKEKIIELNIESKNIEIIMAAGTKADRVESSLTVLFLDCRNTR